MDIQEVLSHIDHTALNTTVTWKEIQALLDESIQCHVASACIPPSFVKKAKGYVGSAIPICTVIGFPNGYQTTAVKIFEAKDAIANGADEIDTVINLGWVKDGEFEQVLAELIELREISTGKILKVIVETSVLTPEELKILCQIVTRAKADYIKTSTGFGTRGASPEDILMMSAHIGTSVKIKASGGIKTLEEANSFLSLGADRIGSSAIVKSFSKGI